jgi:hypothetical protein
MSGDARDLERARVRRGNFVAGIPSLRDKEHNLASMCRPCHDWAGAHAKAFRAWWDNR